MLTCCKESATRWRNNHLLLFFLPTTTCSVDDDDEDDDNKSDSNTKENKGSNGNSLPRFRSGPVSFTLFFLLLLVLLAFETEAVIIEQTFDGLRDGNHDDDGLAFEVFQGRGLIGERAVADHGSVCLALLGIYFDRGQ